MRINRVGVAPGFVAEYAEATGLAHAPHMFFGVIDQGSAGDRDAAGRTDALNGLAVRLAIQMVKADVVDSLKAAGYAEFFKHALSVFTRRIGKNSLRQLETVEKSTESGIRLKAVNLIFGMDIGKKGLIVTEAVIRLEPLEGGTKMRHALPAESVESFFIETGKLPAIGIDTLYNRVLETAGIGIDGVVEIEKQILDHVWIFIARSGMEEQALPRGTLEKLPPVGDNQTSFIVMKKLNPFQEESVKHCPKLAAVLFSMLIGVTLASAQPGTSKGSSKAGSSDVALGIFGGQPTGLTLRTGLGSKQDIELKAAWNFDNDIGYFAAQANWLVEFPGTIVIEGEDIIPYIGAGVGVGFADMLYMGFRVPFGLVYRFAKVPLEICLEVGPGIGIFPGTGFWGTGGLGIRYRFDR